MKFLADMGISPRSVEFLREEGYEAVHLHELGQDDIPDQAILEEALQQGYSVLTHDLDFSELIAVSGAHLPSIVTFRLRNMRPDNVNQHPRAILAQHGEMLQQGAVATVTEHRIRVRPLPIQR
jgi:predicted nuclease of predicted toxin-antitoxin system